jgi:hypothetical protein
MRFPLRVHPATWLLLTFLLAGCGQVENTAGSPAGTLCFDYFQRCVYPVVLDAPLPVDENNDGVFESTKRCSNSGCHESPGTSGGALQLYPNVAVVSVSDPDAARQSLMYINFLSAKGRTDLANERNSPLLQKPLVEVDHRGGRVFVSDQDAAAQRLLFWIQNRPAVGSDEFSTTCSNLSAAHPPPAC